MQLENYQILVLDQENSKSDEVTFPIGENSFKVNLLSETLPVIDFAILQGLFL